MSKKLTLELITQRTKNSNYNEIKTLNLWGKELDDISILSKLPNLEICSLSTNKIQNIEVFENLKNLKELYLKKNLINDIKQIEKLKNLEQLEILSLEENPINSIPDYRNTILEILPQLKKLDDKIVESVSPKHKIIPIMKAKNSKEEKKFEISQREAINLDFNQIALENNNKTTIEDNKFKNNDDDDKEINDDDDDIINLTSDNIKTNFKNLDGKIFKLSSKNKNEIRKKIGIGVFQKKINSEKEDNANKNNINNLKTNPDIMIKNYKKPTIKTISKRMKNVEIPHKLNLSYSDADFKKFLNTKNNQYVKKKLGTFSSKYIKSKNEKIKEKSERYEDTPSKSSDDEENNFKNPLFTINNNLKLSEKNIVANSIKMLLHAVDKESLIDIKNEIDKLLSKK